MGQRSQIYVRFNKNLIVANYYQWNYGERMVSRARYGLETIKENADNGWKFTFEDKHYIERLKRMFDVNFDMKDLQISSYILDEYKEWLKDYPDEKFNEFVFKGQDNNDGQLYIDIQVIPPFNPDFDKERIEIKYCFTDDEITKPLTASEYMAWDSEDWENSEYISNDMKQACSDNIEALNGFTLMTADELQEFVNADYQGEQRYEMET